MDIQLPETEYILRFIDTETGGLSPRTHSLLTIGMLSFYPGEKIPEPKEIRISSSVYSVTTKAMEINGIDLDVLKAEGIFEKVVAEALSQLPTDNVVYIGHNVHFDFRFITSFIESHGYTAPNLSRNCIDTKSMALNRMVNHRIPKMSTSLDVLCPYFGITNEGAHNALHDCYRTAALYSELLKI